MSYHNYLSVICFFSDHISCSNHFFFFKIAAKQTSKYISVTLVNALYFCQLPKLVVGSDTCY